MTDRLFPRIKRFLEGTGGVTGVPSRSTRGRLRELDFMKHDLTGSGRFFSR